MNCKRPVLLLLCSRQPPFSQPLFQSKLFFLITMSGNWLIRLESRVQISSPLSFNHSNRCKKYHRIIFYPTTAEGTLNFLMECNKKVHQKTKSYPHALNVNKEKFARSQHNACWQKSDWPWAGLNASHLHMNNLLSQSQLLAHEVSTRLE